MRSSSRPTALLRGFLAGALPVLAVGCLPEPTIGTTLAELQTELFRDSCAGSSCHGGAAPSRGLNLEVGSFTTTVGVDAVEPDWVRVVPGDTDASLLYQVMFDGVGNTRRMPPGFSLEEGEIAAVRVWIEEGAQDN